MRLTISAVDYAPEELHAQTPFEVELLRMLPGPDRPDYWLGSLATPLLWKHDGSNHQITHVVLAARWVGTQIGREQQLPVGIAYVTDRTILEDARVDFRKCSYVAIGMAQQHRAKPRWQFWK